MVYRFSHQSLNCLKWFAGTKSMFCLEDYAASNNTRACKNLDLFRAVIFADCVINYATAGRKRTDYVELNIEAELFLIVI